MKEVVDESNDDDDDDSDSGEAVVDDERSESGLDAGEAMVVVELLKIESEIVLEGFKMEADVEEEDVELFMMRFKKVATVEVKLLSVGSAAVVVVVAAMVLVVKEAGDI